SVEGMDKYEEFMALTSQAIGILKDMSKRSPYDMASDGMARKTAKNFTSLADVLFGPTDSPRLQRESVALAEERGLSFEYLEMVDKRAGELRKRGAAWRLRAELIAFEGTLEEVAAYAKQGVLEEGGDKPKQRGVGVGRVLAGLRTISTTGTRRR